MTHQETAVYPDVEQGLGGVQVRRIGVADLLDALRQGLDDFRAAPTQFLFIGAIYPIVALLVGKAAIGSDLLPLFYPLVAGLSLMGPVAAIGIYELSRRREQGLEVSWLHVFDVLQSRSLVSIVTLALFLVAIFLAWLGAAQLLYLQTMGSVAPVSAPVSAAAFLERLLGTSEGWELIVAGNLAGAFFAAMVLTLTVISFPLLLDRDVGPVLAVATSVQAVIANPLPMALWGLIVAGLLLLGSLPLFLGLAVVMPILGHATWHLYRKVVVLEP